jgi:tRNA (cytosine49-C5)-methyltransferase
MLKPIPNTENIEFKPKFIERYSALTDFEEFKKYSLSFLRKCIRVNTLKITVEELKEKLKKDWTLEPVPWCKEGFYIKGTRLDIGNLPEHVLGQIYVQESASMIPPIVLDPQPGDWVLDTCAAPGSKTTQMGQYMKNEGVLIANDVAHTRLASLGINTQRCGLTNIIRTKMQGWWFKDLEFDKVLVDAPCSGTGTIRKSLRTTRMWNPNMVKRITGIQKQLLQTGWNVLKKGGVLVYSTCTLEPEENEGVISWFLDKNKDAELMDIELKIKRSDAVVEFEGEKFNPEVKKCLRIWPQDNDSEGFFVTKLHKV